MTATGDIVSGLSTAIDDLDAGLTGTRGAIDHALDVKDRMLALGWEGIADGMQEVADRLDSVLAAAGQAEDHTHEAAGQLRQIDARMSPAEVTEHLHGTAGKVEQARTGVRAALDDLDEAESTVNRALEGGDPSVLLGMIDEVGQRLASAGQQLQDARDGIDAQVQLSAHAGN